MNCICLDCTSPYSFAGSIRESDDANEIEKQLEREQSFKVFPEELADCLISMDCDERDKLHAVADADDLCTCLPEGNSNNSTIVVAVSEVPTKSRTCVAGGAQITSSNADLCAEKLVRGIFPKAPDLVENASFDNLLKDSGVSVVQVRRRLAEIVNDTYLELEKERRASASAAVEAIATITRLQDEKTALKMEAVQQQRMMEEREMFNEEALARLRDFLVKREVEMLAVEKEIELYRRRYLESRMELKVQKGDGDFESRGITSRDCPYLGTISPETMSPNCKASLERLQYLENEVYFLKSKQLSRTQNSLNVTGNFDESPRNEDSEDANFFSPGNIPPDDGSLKEKDHTERSADEDEKDSVTTPKEMVIRDGDKDACSGLSKILLHDWRTASMIKRDGFRSVLKEDAQKLLGRLHALETDRETIRQTICSAKRESELSPDNA